ncbi:IS21 family transposase [Candidatus Symbiobacter mobilis]|uniref:Transposase n=1 Tax=Candidatus Symbiobacter mobilis CR TaxID=946483 RepID=U5NBM3_9BURK|nr:IS21 family transposase [Candidatus Symbiobacter mobilis]AGX88715.1 transposase [Candidatus Symbiobacter mobilis CR]
MPALRINMRKLKDALRLKFEGGQSHQQIARALGISKGVVTKYVGLAVAAALDWNTISLMDEATLERRLLAYPRPSDSYAQPDYGRIHRELARKGVTLTLLWEEYCAEVGDEHSADNPVKPWRYSQFCENYRQFANSLKRSMRQVHRAGEKLFIDYAGPTIALVAGSQEVGRANIFVAAMGVSGYCFACATPAQTARDWLGATAQALSFYGGVPQLIVPDNPRALVTVADRYEPVLTETVQDFARHYGCSVLPARAYHPQDKPKVELSVLLVERWILARLRKLQFASVAEVNDAISPLLQWLNLRAFQKLPGSRCSVFAEIDAPTLKALPMQPWEWADFKTVRVQMDSRVEWEGHRYSVPNALIGQVLELRVTAHALEVLHRGNRVASHMRSAEKGGYTTVTEHLPERHQHHAQWTPERLVAWGERIGVACAATVQKMLERQPHPEHAYRACLGLLSLSKRYGDARLEAACTLAWSLGTCKYTHIRDILLNRRDLLQASATPEWTSPAHAHVRGADYYQ